MSKPLVTPKGIASYPHLDQPDTAFGQNAYKVTLILDASDPEVVELLNALDQLVDESLEAAKKDAKPAQKAKIGTNPPYEQELDDNGDPTGNVIIKFKQNAEINGEAVEIAVVDAKKNRLHGVRVGAGSTIRVGFTTRPYCMKGSAGITRDLRAVQLLNLVEKESSFGFDEEDGFTAAPEATADDADF